MAATRTGLEVRRAKLLVYFVRLSTLVRLPLCDFAIQIVTALLFSVCLTRYNWPDDAAPYDGVK